MNESLAKLEAKGNSKDERQQLFWQYRIEEMKKKTMKDFWHNINISNANHYKQSRFGETCIFTNRATENTIIHTYV